MNIRRISIIIFVLTVALICYVFRTEIFQWFYAPTQTKLLEGITSKQVISEKTPIEIIAQHLQIPWAIAFLPDGDLLVTERPGTLRRIGKNKKAYPIEGVAHQGEGGLLGMALHPRFSENHWIYLYLTTASNNNFKNRIERYRLENDRMVDKKVIFENIPGAVYHDGGRIAFSSDGYLFVTTGDSGKSNLAQDIGSLAGKILRIRDDGAIPFDNPFGNAVWSYGHRNPQGITWDDNARLWATEHGRSGVLSGFDELNLIEKGKNYGWPVIQGDEIKENMESPVAQSGSDETWAPAGMAFWDGSLFFAGLRGEAIYEARIVDEKNVSIKIHFHKEFGRVREVIAGPDGYIYITTSNTDGRGIVQEGDDKIIRIDPVMFRK
ncbi:MAG: PQQ-dependent sugar dehydrogenase [Candidatus Sungbacteria bacterium]|nr:PQQ-dependent sugar dehydrogenase [bacterium]MDZ4260075.1 PQQ-dependent sugar dehydrogenase [Candidatus Sungbacteria bacterium]